MILWNRYYATHWNRNLNVTLNFLQNYAYAGEQAQMTEQIENRKRLMLPVLEVAFHMDRRLTFHDCENTHESDYVYKRDLLALLGNQRVTRTLTLDCTKRGYYRVDESYLTSFSMLHKRRFSVECPADAELYVYATRTDVSDILIACERLMGSIQCAKRLYEDPFAFSSIREYTVTDPMKTINWKASARTGDLMVNTFESTLTERVMICLDIEDSGILKYEYLVEESVSIASSLAQKLIARGMEVGICVNESAHTDTPNQYQSDSDAILIEPAGGKKQLNDIERMLAKCGNNEKVMPFAELLTSFDLSEDTVIIVISKNVALYRSAIENYIGKSRQAIWVIPFTRGDICSVNTSNNIHLIKREVERS